VRVALTLLAASGLFGTAVQAQPQPLPQPQSDTGAQTAPETAPADAGDPIPAPDAPLKLLAAFEAEDEFLMEPGDFLYLPPGVAHDGVALDACATWSIGFRAPSAGELLQGWLSFVEDGFERDERYADPDLQAQRSGAWLSDQFVDGGLQGRVAGQGGSAPGGTPTPRQPGDRGKGNHGRTLAPEG
jgi:hypothetical protein